MAFVIPDSEDEKTDNTENHVKIKTNDLKNTGKSNRGITEKSMLINKVKKKQHTEKNITAKRAIKLNKENNNATVLKIGLVKVKNKIHKINKQKSEKPKRQKQEKYPKDNISSSMKVENIDTDKLDEVLLNAKKKKLNEAVKKDDVEDVLFREDKSPEVVKKKIPLTKQKNANNISRIINKKSNKLNRIGKTKHIKLKAVKGQIESTIKNEIVTTSSKNVHQDKKREKIKMIIQEQSNPSQKVLNGQIENTRSSKKVQQDKKKKEIKLMIQEQNNRNPINFDRNNLRERMLARLKSAQFRFINEKLYTSSGTEASQLFQNDRAAFQSYHEGYRQQVKKWPVNPLDVIIKRIKKMPKSHLIADMGCGEAELARRVPQSVRSFDLQQANDQVEVCDMAHTPLLSESMDAVVFCLALMGTDLTAYLLEANRVLKTGGHLLIAEVESRFEDVNAFTKDVTRLGFKLAKLNRDHEVFFFLEFVKNQAPPVKKSKLPTLTLKPCIYKRR